MRYLGLLRTETSKPWNPPSSTIPSIRPSRRTPTRHTSGSGQRRPCTTALWASGSYRDITTATPLLRNPQTSVDYRLANPSPITGVTQGEVTSIKDLQTLLFLDPPEHSRLRDAGSRPSSTVRRSPEASIPYKTPGHSARASSPTTTTNTAIPASPCAPGSGRAAGKPAGEVARRSGAPGRGCAGS